MYAQLPSCMYRNWTQLKWRRSGHIKYLMNIPYHNSTQSRWKCYMRFIKSLAVWIINCSIRKCWVVIFFVAAHWIDVYWFFFYVYHMKISKQQSQASTVYGFNSECNRIHNRYRPQRIRWKPFEWILCLLSRFKYTMAYLQVNIQIVVLFS